MLMEDTSGNYWTFYIRFFGRFELTPDTPPTAPAIKSRSSFLISVNSPAAIPAAKIMKYNILPHMIPSMLALQKRRITKRKRNPRRTQSLRSLQRNNNTSLRIEFINSICGGFFMRRHRQSLWTNIFFSFAVPVSAGAVCIVLCIAFFSAITFFVLKSIQFQNVFIMVSLIAGGVVSGQICGKYRRKRGLIDGIICGSNLCSCRQKR